MLSEREKTIAERYAQGETYKQIAQALCIAPATVRNHLAAVYRKLDVRSKPALIRALSPRVDSNHAASPLIPEKPSIAVLPFANLSGNPDQDYVSDGMTEDIITGLSRIAGLLVVSRHSTQGYQVPASDVRTIGREQGVRYILEGSTRSTSDRLRVSVQLVDATTGRHLWADSYDRKLGDLFAVQDDVALRVMVEMEVQLTSGEQARLWAGGTRNIEAWQKATLGNVLLGRHVREDNRQAQALLESAIALDPEYAAALTSLGIVHWEDARWGWTSDRDEALQLATDAAHSAKAVDEHYPGWPSLLGLIHLLKGEHERAVALTEQAVALAPGHASSAAFSALALNLSGRPSEAIVRMSRAMRLSPIYPAWYLVPLATSHLLLVDTNRAISILETAVTREPDSNLARVWLVAALMEQGRHGPAEEQVSAILARDPGFSVSVWRSAMQFKDPEQDDRFTRSLRAAGLPK